MNDEKQDNAVNFETTGVQENLEQIVHNVRAEVKRSTFKFRELAHYV